MSEEQDIEMAVDLDGQRILSLRLTNDGGGPQIAVTGELDLSTAHLLTEVVERLASDGPATVKVDMANVTFFSAAGLTALLRACDTVTSRGGQLLVSKPSPMTRRILWMTGADLYLREDADCLDPG
jgi:anti-sigma B factor antagonist